MKQTNKKKLEEFIRVDHAGERGAIKIYEGQLLALNTIVRNEELKKKIGEMKKHEEEHSNFFEDEIEKIIIKIDKIVLIAASDTPRILKVASLQSTGMFLLRDSSNSDLFDISSELLVQLEISWIKLFSIP